MLDVEPRPAAVIIAEIMHNLSFLLAQDPALLSLGTIYKGLERAATETRELAAYASVIKD